MMTLDLLAVLAAHAGAFMLRGDLALAPADLRLMLLSAPLPAAGYLSASHYFGVHRGLQYNASFGDLLDILKAVGAAGALQAAAAAFLPEPPPPSVLAAWPALALLGVAGTRAGARWASRYLSVRLSGAGRRRSAAIVGVGDLAELVYQNMRSDHACDYRVAAFFDHARARVGVRLHGVRVLSTVPELAALLRRAPVDEVVIAVERHDRGAALDRVADALQGLPRRPAVLVAPTLEEALKSPARSEPRKVLPADLLNRRVIPLDAESIARSIEGKVVLISGAGGTIGGELSRQAARYKPRKIVLLENNATALFYSEMELRGQSPDVPLSAVLGDVRDEALLAKLFQEERPQLVFHAAAHKHVHQLETNVCEGVSNNLVGTYQLASAADRAGVETFILISTDKAVRPKCVMGATKRAAEIVVSTLARRSKTRFASVRFGNVLGSSGSVMKIFQEQIQRGQPLTLTHPDATRYFITVEEAVGLVLQASTLARGGEVFVLKMGDQVRIMDMARRLIWLSGLEPGRDVPIRVVGLRPGEKIAEELVEDASGEEQSAHPEIMVLRAENKELEGLAEAIRRLERLGAAAENEPMMRALAQLVPTFSARVARDAGLLAPADYRADGAPAN